MALKSGALNTARIPASKPEIIDTLVTTGEGVVEQKPKKLKVTPSDFATIEGYSKYKKQEDFGDLEFMADVMPEFINPVGILGMNPKYFEGKFKNIDFNNPDTTYTSGNYNTENRKMTVFNIDNLEGLENKLSPKNTTIEHEAIHRGMDILREYYNYDNIKERFGEETADFLFIRDLKSNLDAELITEINDSRRKGNPDAQEFINRFFKDRKGIIETTVGDKVERIFEPFTPPELSQQEKFLTKRVDDVLKILPNIEKLAKERLYDISMKGDIRVSPTEDARGLPKGSLEKDFYKSSNKGAFSNFISGLRNSFRELISKKPDFEETSKQMPKEFNKGGATMEQQMELFGEQGGLKDDGMNRDPISGNEVPSGSMAEEVRDDIPAQLSDGEYVVPADVVRFFGVKFFEDLRMQAKMGLQNMEMNGRIGGEPVAVEDDMLDPKDEQAIRIMMMGNEGGVVKAAEGFDFSKDAASKADPLKPFQSFVGSTFFDAPTTKEIIDGVKDGVINYYHPDGRIQPVRYKDGKLVNSEDEQYTTGQWSTTPPTSEEKTQETKISTDRRDERESSNRERDKGGRDFQQPEMESAESTETLAKRIGGKALYSDAEKTKPLYMTESGYRNLSAEYDRLGLEKKGTSFAEYNNLPMMTKIQMSFGREYSQSDIAKILDKANETPSILQFGLLGAILKPFIDKMGTADEEGMREFKKETPKGFDPYEFFNRDGEFNAQAYYNKIGEGTLLGTTRMDRVLLGIPSNVTPQQLARIEANRIRATDPQAAMKRMKDDARQFTYEAMLEKEERAGKGLTGDLDTVAENEAFEQRMKEARDAAGRQQTTQSGPNIGSDNEDGNQSGTGGQTSDFGASQYQDEFTGVSSPTVSQPTYTPVETPSIGTSGGGKGERFGRFGGFDKGGLASKPKAKAKRKKNTKGLGTKPKAT